MKIRLEANGTQEIHKAGYSFYVQSIGVDADAEIEVKIEGETEVLKPGEGIPSNGVMFHSVTVTNLQNTAVMLDFVIASNNRGIVSNRLAGIVSVDGVVQTASDYERSERGEALQAYAEVLPETGLYGVLQFENPADSGVYWVIQSIETSAGNISLEAPIATTLEPANQVYAFAGNKRSGEPRPYINIYKGAIATRPEPQRTHRLVGASDNPIILRPGGVLTCAQSSPNSNANSGLNYFEVAI